MVPTHLTKKLAERGLIEFQHSHSSQEALGDLPVLPYQELEYVPLHMPSESSDHAEHRTGTTTSGGEVVATYDNQSDDEPFTFDKVEYVSEHEHTSSEPIVTEVVHEKKIIEEVHSSTSHQSSIQEVKQQNTQQFSSGTQQYQPYGEVKESSEWTHKGGDEAKELVPHVVGPRVRDNPRPATVEPGAYKITKYEFKSTSSKNEGGRQIISDTEESSRRHSQSRHTHKEHHHHRRQMDSESALSDTTDDVEIRTQMHLSPASTLVRQSTRPDSDLPPSTGAVKALRDRIELGGSDTEHKEVKQIDIFESLNEPKEDHKVEDIPRYEVNEQNRHAFHELYYRQQLDKPVTQERHHFRSSTGVSSYDEYARHQVVEPHEEVHLRHVGETTGKQTTHQYNEQVNVRRASEVQPAHRPYDETTGYVTRTTDERSQKGTSNQYHEFQQVNLRNVEPAARRQSTHHYNELEQVNLRNVYHPQGETTKRYEQTTEQVNVRRSYEPYHKEQTEHYDESVQVNIQGAAQPAQRGSTNQYHEFQQVNLRSVNQPVQKETTHQYNELQQVNLRSTQPVRRETYDQTVEQVNVRSAYQPYQKETTVRQSQYSTDQAYQQKQTTEKVTRTHDVSQTTGQGAVTKQTYTYTTKQPAEKLQCTCNNCAIHGRHTGPATTVTKRTDEVHELSYKPYMKTVEQVSKTTTKTGTTANALQKTSVEPQDDSRTHKRTTSIHRIEDVHSTGGGIHVGGVVGNLVDMRTAQNELYTTRGYVSQDKQHASSPVPTSPSPTAAARISRPYDDKYNSVRVVRNVRAFVNEWGQKDFVPPGGVPQPSSPKPVVSPTFNETAKVTTEMRNVTSPVQKVVVPTAAAPRSNYVTRTDVTKE
ncbi:hypothetical protein OESDEN_02451 [Oesophagostomum dentatum]|uniref:Uncharacterized protein n=1 Tax=Oesophagostomum dentatum TaxID=61180 RepID=A0A0B1TP28_OESDE|nr:hypothetical protein OESDEN_02451 [Oesophagostomum dentatum]